jgi:hypothetical protein
MDQKIRCQNMNLDLEKNQDVEQKNVWRVQV